MKSRALSLTILAVVAAVGCGVVPESPYPDQRRYALEAEREGEPPTAAGDTILKIRDFTISSRFEGREFVHRERESEWVSDFYNVFFRPPAENLTEQAGSWLTSSGRFGRVVTTGSFAVATHILEGHVSGLYADYRTAGSFLAVLEMQFLLLDERTQPPRIVVHETVRHEVPLADNSAAAVVRGWNKALASVLADLESAIAGSD